MSDPPILPIKSLSSRLGILSRADGSCQWTQGCGCVLAAIYGPTYVKASSSSNFSDTVFLDVRPIYEINDNQILNSNLNGRQNLTELKYYLLSIFKPLIFDPLYPRCKISAIIQIIEYDSNILSCCINAMAMALIDAGVSISHLVSAVTLSTTHRPDPSEPFSITLDPTQEQLQLSLCSLVTAWNHTGTSSFELLLNHCPPNDPDLSVTAYRATLAASKLAASKILHFQRLSLTQKTLYQLQPKPQDQKKHKPQSKNKK
ncbi:exosome complex component RRP46-like [Schistocerca gregaria]|uniref:exosome complex component RRP46-like n=1 Tax=Schistocerca gregaria TaxID=7010 RepID=UPI00211F002F|nr:exosome complex component RRP46-like [Schistocerca gregaria]